MTDEEIKIRKDKYEFLMVVQLNKNRRGEIQCPGALGESICRVQWYKNRDDIRRHVKNNGYCKKILDKIHRAYKNGKCNLDTHFDQNTYNLIIKGIVPKTIDNNGVGVGPEKGVSVVDSVCHNAGPESNKGSESNKLDECADECTHEFAAPWGDPTIDDERSTQETDEGDQENDQPPNDHVIPNETAILMAKSMAFDDIDSEEESTEEERQDDDPPPTVEGTKMRLTDEQQQGEEFHGDLRSQKKQKLGTDQENQQNQKEKRMHQILLEEDNETIAFVESEQRTPSVARTTTTTTTEEIEVASSTTPQTETNPQRQPGINYDLFDKFSKGLDEGFLHANWKSLLDVKLLELFKMLEDSRAPVYLFDKIVEWATSCAINKVFDFKQKSVSREDFVEKMRKRQGQENHLPIDEIITLPYSRKAVAFSKFDFAEALYTLLSDEALMEQENLLFRGSGTNPIVPPKVHADENGNVDFPPEHVFDSLISGKVATVAHKELVEVEGRDLDCMVIWYTDKTQLDFRGNMTMEPLRFTISLFNDATRRRVTSWRTLAFIPKEKLYRTGGYGSKVEEAKQAFLDYQFLLQKAMESFRDLTKKGGIYWEVKYQNRKLPIVLKLYSGMLQGDTVGHNRAVGHYHTGSMKKNIDHKKLFVCRRCNTPFCDLDNWDFPFKLHAAGKIQDKTGLRKGEAKQWGFRFSENKDCTSAFDELGGPIQKMGMMATVGTPQDILHGFAERDRAIETFKIQERREVKTNSTKRGIQLFVGENKTMVEQACNVWGIVYSNQSDRGLPRTSYRLGALSTEKLQSNEKSGLLLLYLTYMCSTVGEYMLAIPKQGATKANDYTRLGLMEPETMRAWVMAFDNMLLCEAFMKSDSLTNHEINLYKAFMPIYLDSIADAERRCNGDGLKLPKLHGRLHNALDIENYGPPKGFDTETGESGHIESGKKHAHKTQKRAWLQDAQQAKQYSIGLAINSSYAAMEMRRGGKRKRLQQESGLVSTLQGKDFQVWREEPGSAIARGGRSSKLKLTICECEINTKKWQRADWKGNRQAQQDLERFFGNEIFPLSYSKSFQLYNSYHPREDTAGDYAGTIYRAQPGSTTLKGYDRGWMDWAWINIGGRDTMAHLICFVELTGVKEQKALSYGGMVEKK